MTACYRPLAMMLLLLLLIVGCGDSAAVDSASHSASHSACAASATPSWEGWAQGFFTTWCQGCHASAAPDRHGAPLNVVFDSELLTRAQAERVRARVIEGQDMPIGGGVYPEELARLEAWLSCGGAGDEGEGGPSSQPLTPSWSAEQLADALALALQAPLTDPFGTYAVYEALLAHRDASCPASQTLNMPPDPAGCEAESGWSFAGPSLWVNEADGDSLSRMLWCDCELLGPEGQRFAAVGNIGFDGEVIRDSQRGDTQRFSLKQGAAYSYPEAGGWLDQGSSGILSVSGELRPDGYALELDALASSLGQHLSFVGVSVDSDTCIGGLGELGLRDPAGGWYHLQLDEDCGGCGALDFEGEPMGRACVSLDGPTRALAEALRIPS